MSARLHVSFPKDLVARPVVYELVTAYGVVPNIRRANVEAHEGWMILELGGPGEAVDAAIEHLREIGCTVNRQEGDILAG